MTKNARILIVEDEPGIAVALYTTLIKSGYAVDTAKTGLSGLRKAANKNYNLIVLDLGLPDMSGLNVCRQLRMSGVQSPIIIVTAENTVRSKVTLFDAGANDYLTKPFSLEELQARIRACLRSTEQIVDHDMLVVGELSLNPTSRSVERSSIVIKLTRKEFAILEYLMQHAGRVVTRASLLECAWDGDELWTNTVDVHVKHLRDKVDRPFAHPLITTVHGVGYKLQVPNL